MHKERRRHKREPHSAEIKFVVLHVQASELNRIHSAGNIVDVSQYGIGLTTEFPLEAGHVLEWDDEHQKGKLHIALVKWSQKLDSLYRAGLEFI
jgi:hypothetical protein